jgi:hypothetical protein
MTLPVLFRIYVRGKPQGNSAFAAALSYCLVLLDLLKKDLERLGPPATRLQSRAGSFEVVCFLSPFVFEQAEQSAQQ